MSITLSLLITILLEVVIGLGVSRGTSSAAPSIVSTLPTLLLPIFTVTGSFGALMIFVSDKDKGVYEYLLAYGLNPSQIFWSIVLSAMGLVSIVLVIAIPVSVGVALALGNITTKFIELLALYVIPISYTVSIFITMAGMIWSSLAVRRTGINSPVGVISLIGILPMLAVLYSSLAIPPQYIIPFVGAVSLALFVAVVLMIRVSNAKMVRERLLSSA